MMWKPLPRCLAIRTLCHSWWPYYAAEGIRSDKASTSIFIFVLDYSIASVFLIQETDAYRCASMARYVIESFLLIVFFAHTGPHNPETLLSAREFQSHGNTHQSPSCTLNSASSKFHSAILCDSKRNTISGHHIRLSNCQ